MPGAEDGAVRFDGSEEVMRTAGREAAACGWPGAGVDHGAENPLVEKDEQADQGGEDSGNHEAAGFGESGRGRMPRRRAWRTQSASSSAKEAVAASARAMVTM